MRKLHPELKALVFKYLDENLATNEKRNPKMVMIKAAIFLEGLGIKESGGNNKGHFVEMFQWTCDRKAIGESWCMGLQQTLIAFGEEYTGIKSEVFASEGCTETWTKSPAKLRTDSCEGTLAIWKLKDSWEGHTELAISEFRSATFYTVGGNTGVAGLQRDGDALLWLLRTRSAIGNKLFVGFLDPFPEYSLSGLALQ